jgi:myosin heavy subunit
VIDDLPAPAHLVAQFSMLAAEQSEGGEARGISAEELLQTCGVEADGYAIGRTKVFLRQGILQELQRQRLEWIGLRAVHVQALMRGTMGRREAARRREERKRAAEMARRREEEARRRAEEEARLAREAEERRLREEEEARRREEEAKQRQQAVQKARALSFQRRAKKKVRGRLILTLTLILTSPSTLTLPLTTHHLPLCAPHHRST